MLLLRCAFSVFCCCAAESRLWTNIVNSVRITKLITIKFSILIWLMLYHCELRAFRLLGVVVIALSHSFFGDHSIYALVWLTRQFRRIAITMYVCSFMAWPWPSPVNWLNCLVTRLHAFGIRTQHVSSTWKNHSGTTWMHAFFFIRFDHLKYALSANSDTYVLRKKKTESADINISWIPFVFRHGILHCCQLQLLPFRTPMIAVLKCNSKISRLLLWYRLSRRTETQLHI